jgi:hypothetical protein
LSGENCRSIPLEALGRRGFSPKLSSGTSTSCLIKEQKSQKVKQCRCGLESNVANNLIQSMAEFLKY